MLAGVPRVLCFADSDSYVKWGASLVSRLPPEWDVRFVILASTAMPSPRQIRDALDGSVVDHATVPVWDYDRLREELASRPPDVLIASARGPVVQAITETLDPCDPQRPVIVTGLPGISVPALPIGLRYRSAADLLVVHSHREVRDFRRLAREKGIEVDVELATLPFLLAAGNTPQAVRRSDIVFATQAKIPSSRAGRHRLLVRLVDTALAQPDRRVVVKIRAEAGEEQTHLETDSYGDLVEEMRVALGDGFPANLVIASGPMREHLARACAVVSVSSTALVEAMAYDVPVIALTDFGVRDALINTVFYDSGVLAASDDMVAGRFHRPSRSWLRDNYFHPASDETWLDRLVEMLEKRQVSGMQPFATMPPTPVNRLRLSYYRHLAFIPRGGRVRQQATRRGWRLLIRGNALRWKVVRKLSS